MLFSNSELEGLKLETYIMNVIHEFAYFMYENEHGIDAMQEGDPESIAHAYLDYRMIRSINDAFGTDLTYEQARLVTTLAGQGREVFNEVLREMSNKND